MTLTCPHCGFSRELAPGQIPADAVQATCPRCRREFTLEEGANPAVREPPPGAASLPGPSPGPAPADLPKAGFWIRTLAFLLDSVIVTVLQFAAALILGTAVSLVFGADYHNPLVELVIRLCGTVLAMTYYVGFIGYIGQTPGKMAVRVRVIRTDGSAIGYGRAFLREVVGKFLSGILLGIGYFMVAFDGRKQGLHDKIADTYVIKL